MKGNFLIQAPDPIADYFLEQEQTDMTNQNITDYSLTKLN